MKESGTISLVIIAPVGSALRSLPTGGLTGKTNSIQDASVTMPGPGRLLVPQLSLGDVDLAVDDDAAPGHPDDRPSAAQPGSFGDGRVSMILLL
jgi:hypothetical protein